MRILNLEDNPYDTELIRARLEEDGIFCEVVRVDTREDYILALKEDTFDLILGDYSLPGFDGFTALELALEKSPEIPFIFVSGIIGEDLAIETLKKGATDYVLKSRLQRLGPAVKRAILETRERADRRKAEEELRNAHNELERRVEERTAELSRLTGFLQNEISERTRAEKEIKHMAHHDALTDLPNRRLFVDILTIELAEARRNQTKLAILFMDLDRFKEINDTLGHDAGDELLKKVAGRLKSTIRDSDAVARIGGDEFNIILPDISRAETVAAIVQKIMKVFRKPFMIGGHELLITISIGISIYPDDSNEPDALLRYADIAMYHAKEMGRNTFQFYNPDINFRSVERMRMGVYLRRALDRNELVVYYQPQVEIKTKKIICAEALIRWQHSDLGLLTPAQFIPLAEETGFITSIDEWVLRTAGSQVRSWLDTGMPSLCITVNLSARQFQSPELVSRVTDILEETGMPPEYLDIEITESTAMSNVERTAERLRKLTSMGVHISIDDFGTGYSSLNYLKRLPVERLKIDKSFIQDIATDPDDRAIINAVTAMAHSMNMKVIAEGVETREQLSFLHSTGCDEAQGYYFSRPLPLKKFEEFIADGI